MGKIKLAHRQHCPDDLAEGKPWKEILYQDFLETQMVGLQPLFLLSSFSKGLFQAFCHHHPSTPTFTFKNTVSPKPKQHALGKWQDTTLLVLC